MGLFSLVGSILGGGSQKKAIAQATAAQVDASNRGIDESRRQFDLQRGDYAPYLGAGTDALSHLKMLIGVGGSEGQASEITSLQNSPLFKSIFNTGQEAVLQNASATGGVRGGNTIDALADFGGNTLAQVIQNQIGNYSGLAGMGLGATNSTTQAGQASTQNIIQLLGNIGSAKAGGSLAKGAVNAGMWNNIGKGLDDIASGSGLFGGSGGGIGSLLGKITI